MSEYTQLIIDNINIDSKSISIAVSTMIDTSAGPVLVKRWRCAYQQPDGTDKLVSDLHEQAPGCDYQLVIDLVDRMWA